jgi:hypothetical protein
MIDMINHFTNLGWQICSKDRLDLSSIRDWQLGLIHRRYPNRETLIPDTTMKVTR